MYKAGIVTLSDKGAAGEREDKSGAVIREILDNSARFDILSVTGDGIYPENRIDFGACAKEKGCTVEEMSRQINEAFAEITHRIFSESSQFQGLYTSGGDVTVAVCARFGTAGLCLLDEVLPLAAYGTFLKGDYEGISIITKGGMVGESDAVNRCVTYLKQKLFM